MCILNAEAERIILFYYKKIEKKATLIRAHYEKKGDNQSAHIAEPKHKLSAKTELEAEEKRGDFAGLVRM